MYYSEPRKATPLHLDVAATLARTAADIISRHYVIRLFDCVSPTRGRAFRERPSKFVPIPTATFCASGAAIVRPDSGVQATLNSKKSSSHGLSLLFARGTVLNVPKGGPDMIEP